MAKAYSEDLRWRVVNAFNNSEGSKQEIADRFSVSHDFVNDMVNLFNETGNVTPQKIGGYNKPKIDAENLEWLNKKVKENKDAILEELCDSLEKETQIKVSNSTMYRALKYSLNISYKKKRFTQMKEKKKM